MHQNHLLVDQAEQLSIIYKHVGKCVPSSKQLTYKQTFGVQTILC